MVPGTERLRSGAAAEERGGFVTNSATGKCRFGPRLAGPRITACFARRAVPLVALASIGCGPTPGPDAPLREAPAANATAPGTGAWEPDPTLGRQIAVDVCGGCHALEGEGPSPHRAAPPFPILARRLSVDTLLPLLEEEIRAVHPDMPEIRLAPAEIDSFLAFWSQL
ncbi:MAG: hypothetical protein K6T74_04420 [Geminicoccaceae bacterium]|nr:hypothetical protein [Geminicoccaceae bacterium]